MSLSLDALEKEAQTLRSKVEGNSIADARKLLTKLKIALIQLPSLPPCGVASATSSRERSIARHVLESATIFSILTEDMASFERNFTQLKVFYNSFDAELPASMLRFPILGARLLHLLVENRMAEFHNELELIPSEGRQDTNIAFAIKLEQYLMEGSYNKVLDAREHVPNAIFKFFLSQLLQTVRENIADCAEIAYPQLRVADAQQMLLLNSSQELLSYVQTHRSEWKIQGDYVLFKLPAKSLGASDIPSLKLVGETLSYATELDRIV